MRDEDVAILALERLAAEAPAEIARGIERFIEERRARLAAPRDSLAKAVEYDALATLQRDFESALERAVKAPSHQKQKKRAALVQTAAEVSFRKAGQSIIRARLEELQELSESLYRPLKAAPLHRMRIASKRLRYAIELFTPCWKAHIEPFAEEVSALQTSLGELHDCDVWIETFGAWLANFKNVASQSNNAPGIAADQRSAPVWLLSHFTKARTKHFRDALARWHAWEQSDFAARLCAEIEINGVMLASNTLKLLPLTMPAADAVASDPKAH